MCCMVKVAYLPIVWVWELLQLAVSAYNNVQIQQSIRDVKIESQGFSVSQVGRPVIGQFQLLSLHSSDVKTRDCTGGDHQGGISHIENLLSNSSK